MMKPWPILALVVFALALAARAEQPQLDRNALAQASAKTRLELSRTPAIWTARLEIGNGVLETAVASKGSMRRMVVTASRLNQRFEIFRVIVRDGFWYVIDRTGRHKFRPYEAPTDSVDPYVAITQADPTFVGPNDSVFTDKLDNIIGDVATFRMTVRAAAAQAMAGSVRQLQQLQQTGHPLTPENQHLLDVMTDALANGLRYSVSISRGLYVDRGSDLQRTLIEDFQFQPQMDDTPFAVRDQTWNDESADPTAGNLNDLLMILHAPGVHVGDTNYEPDGRLMDLATGRFRRLPFPGAGVAPICFLPDRHFVIVSGIDRTTGSGSPYRIDLGTGQCDRLGSPLLDAGLTLQGDISPDRKTLVVNHLDGSAGPLGFQLALIDLATTKATLLGKPFDGANPHFTVDGQHVIVVRRVDTDLSAPAKSILASMDMSGQMTDLRSGNLPILINDRKTILYLNDDTQQWRTCDLAGNNDALYAGGLKGFNFPSLAPDGKRLAMIHFVPGAMPKPVILPLGGSDETPITEVDGLWAVPVWH